MLIGRLHCLIDTWQDTSVAFLLSGGFVSKYKYSARFVLLAFFYSLRIFTVRLNTLVLLFFFLHAVSWLYRWSHLISFHTVLPLPCILPFANASFLYAENLHTFESRVLTPFTLCANNYFIFVPNTLSSSLGTLLSSLRTLNQYQWLPYHFIITS